MEQYYFVPQTILYKMEQYCFVLQTILYHTILYHKCDERFSKYPRNFDQNERLSEMVYWGGVRTQCEIYLYEALVVLVIHNSITTPLCNCTGTGTGTGTGTSTAVGTGTAVHESVPTSNRSGLNIDRFLTLERHA